MKICVINSIGLQDREYVALVDFPPAFFYKEILDAFPKAKVILGTRNPSTWHESVVESTMKAHDILSQFPASILMDMNKPMKDKMEVGNEIF